MKAMFTAGATGAALALAACAATGPSPVVTGMTEAEAAAACPGAARVAYPLGEAMVIECALRPEEVAVIWRGEIAAVWTREEYAREVAESLCADAEDRAACEAEAAETMARWNARMRRAGREFRQSPAAMAALGDRPGGPDRTACLATPLGYSCGSQ
ncbi:MAG: hypothetical protein KIS81_04940 [Maricaulaceae bacterium]|nr:hypothetical protein [Maricaulaceae bacterium]